MDQRELLAKIVDNTANGEEIRENVKDILLHKLRNRTLTEVGNVVVKNNDVFVSGKKVGSVNVDDDDTVVEFIDEDGKKKEFDSIEDMHVHISKVYESTDNRQKRMKRAISRLPDNRGDKIDSAVDRIVVKSSDGGGEVGDYKFHDTRGSKHKDSRMDKPKKHDHGHDDKSGVHAKKKSEKTGPHPEDKKHTLKDRLHKDERMENPTGHDHGHDDKGGKTPIPAKGKSGSNPPDKTHDTRKSTHKDSRMDNPKKHDHGHDDPSGVS
jgi:hypothetical protein